MRVAWGLHWDNSPGIELLVTRNPSASEYVYEKRAYRDYGHTCDGHAYKAVAGDLVSFFHYAGPGSGYCGRHFKLEMWDGTEETLIGPWSSNSEAVNSVFVGYEPEHPLCMEASYTDSEDDWARGYTFFAGAVLVESVRQHLKPPVEIVQEGLWPDRDPTGSWYHPTLSGMNSCAAKKRLRGITPDDPLYPLLQCRHDIQYIGSHVQEQHLEWGKANRG